MKKILVVDDEIGIRQSLKKILEKEGYEVLTASNGEEAFKVIRSDAVDLLISDIRMAGMDGLELLKVCKSVSPYTEVIMITGYASVDTAVDSMKQGAYDYITKPFKKADIVKAVQKAIEKQILTMDNVKMKERIEAMEAAPLIETASPAMKKLVEIVHQVAPSKATVLIMGESGTGKEVIADMIHKLSPRAGRAMVKVNCAAIPETLIESELFGYEKGAFTGAAGRKEGRFEVADRSSIFLDEVGEVPQAVQVKLLRILQEETFERLGSNKTVKVDTRIIAATNKNLAALVKDGQFREDLYWRLNVITLQIPPLRERREDIPNLVQHFINRFSRKNEKEMKGLESKAMEVLLGYGWPGNVRELENVIERSVVLDRDGIIGTDDLPAQIQSASIPAMESVTIPLGTPLEEVERILMEETLKRTKGDKGLASKLLGISTRTLYRKMDKKE
ncbi:MAG TPA: sigma-54 dependent transcriptional regulator [Deltaproteobacteria bacterium]|jgi:two-component system response regulator HydG|nr:sigma-54 dependent transcriptional regulator [Deltaproteobacteria bacterium]HRW79390.1 sigma-54 dependent transcriptional regulator [Desulfomonilia bacterium]HNS88857.1 sigma-54 dependent transcriptional regulator [Deltaproteobacteria bacterium]HOA43909.1 sigma-54 dependent transcriptional regulator [Deltaproteobacteria bacterium]HOC75676.1 sigma-54 dependent transcriptional regulator [Deltaproteobacteria bacterium]